MKKMLVIAMIGVISTLGHAVTVKDLTGSFKISNPDLPVLNIVTVSANGGIKLTEQSPYGTLECKGKGAIKNEILESVVNCTNGATFTQKINLKGVKNFNKFKAPVYSSLYEQEVVMNFERL